MGMPPPSPTDEGLELILHLVKFVSMSLLFQPDIPAYEHTSLAGLLAGFRRDSCLDHQWGAREADRGGAIGVRLTARCHSGRPHLAGSEAPGPAAAYADR